MPDSFAESADGILLVANGIDPVARWDGYSDQADPAGVLAPTATPVLAADGTGTGALAGRYRIYLRFVDGAGNLSNLSPVSAEVELMDAGLITFSNLEAPQQQAVVRRQVLRNTDGQYTTFYVDVDTEDVAGGTLTSTKTDSQLAASEAVPLLDADLNLLAMRYDPPPSHKPFLAFHLDRMWLAGERPYAEGSVSVATFSATVTGVGTEWPATFAGRFLYARGASRAYEIDAVDVGAQTLTLTEPYADATDPFAEYAVKAPPAETPLVYFSDAGAPEAWPATNALSLPEDGDTVTGLMPYRSFLYVLKRKKLYRLTAQSDPLRDGFIFQAIGRGCVNHRCWAIADQQAYLLDEAGVYRYAGGDTGEPISTPIQNLFRRADGINWQAQRYFHCLHSPAEEVLRWFVALRGEYLPRHALCYAYRAERWWVEEYPAPVGCSRLGRAGRPTAGWQEAGEQPFLGGPAGAVYLLGGADTDGVGPTGATVSGTATAAGVDTLTDARAAFDTAWANVPVAVVAGRGAGQVRVVVAATATALRVAEPWSTRPDATSRYLVGGFRFRYTSSRYRYAAGEAREGRSVELTFAPTPTAQEAWLRVLPDFAAAAFPQGRATDSGVRPGARAAAGDHEVRLDLSRGTGTFWYRFDGQREMGVDGPRWATVQVEGVAGPDRVRLGQMLLNGMVG